MEETLLGMIKTQHETIQDLILLGKMVSGMNVWTQTIL